jgi:excisionase family DNA binding protein
MKRVRNTTPAPQRLSVASAAMLLGISPFTLRRWLRDRQLAFYQCGRRIVLDRSDVEEFLRVRRVEAQPRVAAG